jgi:hypothetical protein
MKRIILFGTAHEKNGKCNIEELYNILLEIKPDIIFEEIPTSMFDDIYNEYKFYDTLEVSSVRKYLEKYSIRHIPVDIIKHDKTIIEYEDKIYDSKIKELLECINAKHKENGFLWINTKEPDKMIMELHELHKNYFTNNEKDIFETYEKNDNYHFNIREKIILNNINEYAEEYNNGILLIGGYHRPTLISKIEKLKNNKGIEWEYFYGEKNI